jgi:hypothetical protein
MWCKIYPATWGISHAVWTTQAEAIPKTTGEYQLCDTTVSTGTRRYHSSTRMLTQVLQLSSGLHIDVLLPRAAAIIQYERDVFDVVASATTITMQLIEIDDQDDEEDDDAMNGAEPLTRPGVV